MNERWQLVTSEMADWIREAESGRSQRPACTEWVFAIEHTSAVVSRPARRRRAGHSKRMKRGAFRMSLSRPEGARIRSLS